MVTGLFIGNEYNQQSFITFGGYDDSMMSSNITWNPMVSNYFYWQTITFAIYLGNDTIW
jgi:hypothetical protein